MAIRYDYEPMQLFYYHPAFSIIDQGSANFIKGQTVNILGFLNCKISAAAIQLT